jgi:hypothetical protein
VPGLRTREQCHDLQRGNREQDPPRGARHHGGELAAPGRPTRCARSAMVEIAPATTITSRCRRPWPPEALQEVHWS